VAPGGRVRRRNYGRHEREGWITGRANPDLSDCGRGGGRRNRSWISLARLVAAAGKGGGDVYITVAWRGAAVAAGQNEVGGGCWFQREGGVRSLPDEPGRAMLGCWPPHRRRPLCGGDTTR